MPDQVQLRLASGQHRYGSGGSEQVGGGYQIVVQNLDYVKEVGIWCYEFSRYGFWMFYPGHYVESVADGREIWSVDRSGLSKEFVARYTVKGVTYWDNNGGSDYHVPTEHTSSVSLLGRDVQVARLEDSAIDATHLQIRACVKNLAYDKVVGIVYTTDNWASAPQIAYGHYVGGDGTTCDPCTEIWEIDVAVPSGQTVKYAVFYRALGHEHWDNNFWRDYTVSMAAAVLSKAEIGLAAALTAKTAKASG
jgi:hypothetical protein